MCYLKHSVVKLNLKQILEFHITSYCMFDC